MTDYDNNLLREAIVHLKAGDVSMARRYLERALETADDLQTRAGATFHLSQVTDDPIQKRKLLEESIACDPVNAEPRRLLAILDGKLKPADIVDPDAAPASPRGEAQPVSSDRFTCPQCRGRRTFAPDGHTLVCEYCTSTQALRGKASATGQDFVVAMASGKGHRAPVVTQLFTCQGCGAVFILAPQVLTAACAFCASPHVLAHAPSELLIPDAILPMSIDQEQASQALIRWMEEKRIRPQGTFQPPRGVYLPIWVFSIIGNIPWKGKVIRNKQQVAVSGDKSILYSDLYVAGTRHLPRLMTALLSGFDLSTVLDYDPRYLVGWPAEAYELTMSDAALEARRLSVERIRHEIKAEYGHVIDLSYSASNIAVESFRLVLVPLWIAAYTLQDKNFPVAINGLTGSVSGEAPSGGLPDWLGGLLGTRR
jgi:hypothetical protein